MKSSSSSSCSSSSYDVFLSFSGVDTRNTFTAHLYTALTGAGFNTFIDDEELPRGENISEELVGAIQGSNMSIIVFSTNYAESHWCLEELVKIMECKRSVGQIVLPIYYHVDPSDVRKQKGSFAKAFENHENSYPPEKVQLWRNVLVQATDLGGTGWHLEDTENEAKFIKTIVKEVSRKAMGSSLLSSSSSTALTYDVFLSFMGEDTRNTFTGHLYEALTGAGINTFIDDEELPRSENINTELVGAIQISKISVIIFSRNYAKSRWCLEELVNITECRRTLGQIVLPIFYHVEPSDVRHQKGSFDEAFVKYEKRIDSDQVMRWRNALKQAGNLSGWHLQKTENEAKAIEEIVEVVLRKLNPKILFIAPYVVGINSRLNDVGSMLAVECGNTVRMVGILGSGGIGKTAIAKAIYNEFSVHFDGSSFLANVRETWQQPHCRVGLQEKLLSDTLSRKTQIDNVDRGIMVIKERLCHKRVLVIIDDVDHSDQLSAIVGRHDWVGPGSRIIITTRDRHILKNHNVDSIYLAEEMSDTESLELFSLHAFGSSSPREGYSELSESVVGYCGGLPLALQVLGAFFSGRSTQEWRDSLEKLRRIPHSDIQQKLKISYDSLSDEKVKDIFLDISCFFIGEDRYYAQQILDGCDLYPEIGINLLFERCLVTINEQNKLMMHGLLRDMAREIIREKSPKDPGKWSRLWYHKDVLDVLRKHKGTENIEGISLKLAKGNSISFNTKSFEKMQGVRLLQLNYVKLTGSYEHISKDLRWLCWQGFPLKVIPDNFDLEDLVTMELRYSNLRQVWKHSKSLKNLTYLDLSHSHYLTHTPDFSAFPKLKKLILADCTSLHELHHSTGHLEKLVLLTLEGCKNLKNLPKSFYKLKSLETLILSGCSMIDHLDEDLGALVSLTTLLTDSTGITEPPRTILRLSNLNRLSICGSKASSSREVSSLFFSWQIPSAHSRNVLLPSFRGLNSMIHLNLSHCNFRADDIPIGLWHLPFLTSFDTHWNSSFGLPSLSLCELDSPMSVDRRMHEVPDLPANLSLLSAESCTTLQQFPNGISPLTISQARSMTKQKHHYIRIKKGLKISKRLKKITKAESGDVDEAGQGGEGPRQSNGNPIGNFVYFISVFLLSKYLGSWLNCYLLMAPFIVIICYWLYCL